MKDDISCEEIRVLIDKMILNKESLTTEEQARVLMHTSTCEKCSQYLIDKTSNKSSAKE